ncbi:MAG: serine--tRNA ligase [Candidatus Pacebacteria bacterium RIFOXYB1_FULL_39_46]|nr:MAG: serine--tRNA ligase [Candidatus Pacebacteria bacterium RIFOXYB1_FULL_39_46]OGJ39307.1 MAG: serine--tRNA ligase [Candidatus Pacebacteria bacterium RIFOXYA1_FULL_38_18]OGJ40987.1 MAG: serine--tRNA ligase [Candidatus Pacebacteria bacterium RIFOXYD1_FULL_39_27]OGJ41168.1 MAG: serine--tRNA ligase [Candidatus Pacebacteria bacterium RIFOXYC1_FULL_39_21]
MLDINYIRKNAEVVRKACQNKQLDSSVVDQVLAVDEHRRELMVEVQTLRQQANENAKTVKQQVADGQRPTEEAIAKGKEIKEQLKAIEPQLKEIEEKFDELMLAVPNVPAEDVPVGKDETGNQVLRQEGELPQFDFKPKQHQELMEKLDMLDTKRAVRIAGFRAYFLKNNGLLLEQALLAYALDLMAKHGFTLMNAPVLVNKEALIGTGYFPWGEEDHYVTQDGSILTGTSEVALTAYYAGETLTEKDLPIKLTGISPCFRREVGSYGKDTQGIIRVHQFNKVEQMVYTVANEAETRVWHDKMLGFSEELLKNLELPYQVLLMCTGDMGAGQCKKYDLETWFPAQNKYRETHSASYFKDFQSRRLNIRYQAQDGSLQYVYTLNNTVAASPRLLAAIIENYQQADGTIGVPKVLQPYLNKTKLD